jgi:anaerobic selenocysteine-containing dehydrogenase
MGVDHPAYRDSFEDLVSHLVEGPWTPEGGWDRKSLFGGTAQRLNPPVKPWRTGKLGTPSGKFELFSEGLARMGLSPVPEYVPSPEGHLDNDLKSKYPLQFLSPHAHHFINSSFANIPFSQRSERGPEVRMHPQDAAERGLASGTPCRVFNDRGDCVLTVRVTKDVAAGVCVADSVWWPRFHPDRKNVNQLTSQDQTDLGGGARFQDCLVQVEALPLL